MSENIQIESVLQKRIDSGKKALVVYITGGLGEDWIQTMHSVIDAGADVVEIGIPFSDPVMDGPIIQMANDSSMKSGSTPVTILNDLREERPAAPLAVMTYYNLAYRMGHERFAASLASAGISGCILPDLPLEDATEEETAKVEVLRAAVMKAKGLSEPPSDWTKHHYLRGQTRGWAITSHQHPVV